MTDTGTMGPAAPAAPPRPAPSDTGTIYPKDHPLHPSRQQAAERDYYAAARERMADSPVARDEQRVRYYKARQRYVEAINNRRQALAAASARSNRT